jgi:sec-independent protein translocase protein TatB
MFDIGWQELFLIAVVALIVVGPKDLPKVLRTAARVMQKARAMSREFQSGLAEMAREAELDEIKRKVEGATRFDLGDELRKSVDPTGKLSADFDPTEFNRQLKESVEGGPLIHPAAPIALSPSPVTSDSSGSTSPAAGTALPTAAEKPPPDQPTSLQAASASISSAEKQKE